MYGHQDFSWEILRLPTDQIEISLKCPIRPKILFQVLGGVSPIFNRSNLEIKNQSIYEEKLLSKKSGKRRFDEKRH